MAQIILTIPDAEMPRVLAALARTFAVDAEPATVRRALVRWVRNRVKHVETENASRDAAEQFSTSYQPPDIQESEREAGRP